MNAREAIEQGFKQAQEEEMVKNISIVLVDGCEYLILKTCGPWFGQENLSITHKGNCKNHKINL